MTGGILSLLWGSVRVRVESNFPERVLNLCSARGLSFTELQWLSASSFRFTLSRRDYRALRTLCAALEVRLSVERTRGLPYAARRLRRRYALLAGLCICVAGLAANSFFIWDLQVTGNETVSADRILRVLAKNGVRRGAFAYSYDQHELCNHALLDLPELCWLTVNMRGCRAHVIVRERVKSFPILNETQPTNVISRRDALVTAVRAVEGEAKVLRGDTVRKGQLLISGVMDTRGVESPTVGTRIQPGRGEVMGRTWYELAVRVPLSVTEKTPAEKGIARHALLWGEKRFKLYGKGSSILEADCDKILSHSQWTLPGGLVLPITWESETLIPYETYTRTRSREEAEAAGRAVLEAYLTTLLGETGKAERLRCASSVQDDWLLVTLSAECSEQIGEEVPIPLS